MSGTPSQHSILLEAGTNELEILVFRLGSRRCGVNVAKVREVIEPQPLTRLPESPPAVMGMFQLRNVSLPLIDLRTCLGLGTADQAAYGKVIVLEYNDSRVAFLVDTVEYIHRIKMKEVESLPDMDGINEAPVTFVAHIEGDLVLMIDFEKIVFDIAGIDPFAASAEAITENRDREQSRVLLAEDSATIRYMIKSNLAQAGYTGLTACVDGQAAWDTLEENVNTTGSCGFDLIITDIEMPRMDGLHMTKRIKEHPQMKDVPVVVFSSLVSADNDKKCKSVGADAQITKPQLAELVTLVDKLVGRPQAVAVPG